MTYPWFNLAVALALGLLIGIERERTKGEGPTRRPAGIRTFGLAAMLGAIAIHLGGILLLAVATAGVAALAAISHVRERAGDPGLTTEIALMLAPLLGGIAMSDLRLAAGIGVTVAVLLAMKAAIHGFVKTVLTDREVNDGLAFAIATLVVWPQLPDRHMGPLAALNPHMLWLVVILVLAIGACGHIAIRMLGQSAGLPVAGLAAGFVSSTAAIGAMASRAERDPTQLAPAVAGAALSTVATFAQLALLLFVVSRPTLVILAPALAAGGSVAAIYGVAFACIALKSRDAGRPEVGHAFSILTALILAGTMAAMLIGVAALKQALGDTGITIGAAVAGIVDTHAAAVSVAALVASAQLSPLDAVVPILAAMTCNVLSKIAMALSAGSSGFALRIVPGLTLSMATAWAIATATLLR